MLQRPDVDGIYAKLWQSKVVACQLCSGQGTIAQPYGDFDIKFVACSCKKEVLRVCALLDGNVPKKFWNVDSWTIEHNLDVYGERIQPYCKNLPGHRADGYGMLFFGENGVGKTTFAIHVLAAAQAAGFSIGYILAPQLMAYTLEARNNGEMGEWLRGILSADYLVIDEMGKEHKATGSEFALSELDTLLRTRNGDNKPTIMVTNMNWKQFTTTYGASVASIVKDSLQVHFEHGDHRAIQASRRVKNGV